MKIALHIGAGDVTGSAFYLQSVNSDIFIDFGIFQGNGSLVKELLDGSKSVRIFGKNVVVNAHIASLGALSAHAGQNDLLKWFDKVSGSKPKPVLSHGKDRGRKPLAEIIQKRYGINPVLPDY
jgi:metallo-beta-lactamase family protein